jgi:hypothetical protein
LPSARKHREEAKPWGTCSTPEVNDPGGRPRGTEASLATAVVSIPGSNCRAQAPQCGRLSQSADTQHPSCKQFASNRAIRCRKHDLASGGRRSTALLPFSILPAHEAGSKAAIRLSA